jgi:hypothetical protein
MRWLPLTLMIACSAGSEVDGKDTDAPDPDTDLVDTDPEDTDVDDTDVPDDTDVEDPPDGTPTGPACITVDGSGAYDRISAAIDAASDGDEIGLCAGTWTEEVTVDKAVVIRGESPDDTVVVGSFRVTAADAGGWDLTLQGPVTLEADGGRLFQVAVAHDATCIAVSDVEGAVIDQVTTTDCTTGIETVGGIVEVHGTTLTGGTDGVVGADTDLVVRSLSVSGHTGAGIRLDGGDLQLVDAQFSGGTHGLDLTGMGDVSLDNLRASDATWSGARIEADTVLFDTVLIDGDRATVHQPLDHADWDADRTASTAAHVSARAMTIRDSTLSGYNGATAVLVGTAAVSSLELEEFTLDDAARIGLHITDFATQAVNTFVYGTQPVQPPAACEVRDQLWWDAGIVLEGGTHDFADGEVLDAAGAGLVARDSVVALSDVTFARNRCAGAIIDGGSLDSFASTFDDGESAPFGGGLVCLEADSFTGAFDVFRGSPRIGVRERTEITVGADVVRTEITGPVGLDLHLIGCQVVDMETPQFSGGGRHLLADGSVGLLTSALFEGPSAEAATLIGASAFEFIDSVVDGGVGTGAYVRNSTLTAEAFEVIGVSPLDMVETTYLNGVVDSTASIELPGHAVEARQATVSLVAPTFEDAGSDAVFGLESDITLDSATLGTPFEDGATLIGCETTILGGGAYGVRDGIDASGGTLDVSGFDVAGTGTGFVLRDDVRATFAGTSADMGRYGMSCVSAATVQCTTTQVVGDLGALDACPMSCAGAP